MLFRPSLSVLRVGVVDEARVHESETMWSNDISCLWLIELISSVQKSQSTGSCLNLPKSVKILASINKDSGWDLSVVATHSSVSILLGSSGRRKHEFDIATKHSAAIVRS